MYGTAQNVAGGDSHNNGLRQTTPGAMCMARPVETLKEYERCANHLLAVSDRAAVEEAARILASYVAHYQLRYGPISTSAKAHVPSEITTTRLATDRTEALRVLAAALTVGGAFSLMEAD